MEFKVGDTFLSDDKKSAIIILDEIFDKVEFHKYFKQNEKRAFNTKIHIGRVSFNFVHSDKSLEAVLNNGNYRNYTLALKLDKILTE